MNCARRWCSVELSVYNPGPYCWTHTPDLTSGTPVPAHVRGGRNRAGTMGRRFLRGIREDLTAEERARFESAAWLGDPPAGEEGSVHR